MPYKNIFLLRLIGVIFSFFGYAALYTFFSGHFLKFLFRLIYFLLMFWPYMLPLIINEICLYRLIYFLLIIFHFFIAPYILSRGSTFFLLRLIKDDLLYVHPCSYLDKMSFSWPSRAHYQNIWFVNNDRWNRLDRRWLVLWPILTSCIVSIWRLNEML